MGTKNIFKYKKIAPNLFNRLNNEKKFFTEKFVQSRKML